MNGPTRLITLLLVLVALALVSVTTALPAGATSLTRTDTATTVVATSARDAKATIIAGDSMECHTTVALSHHPDDDPVEKAEAWERGARKHAAEGKHERAAKSYEEAAKWWKQAGEFNKADAAYRKAARHREQAARTADSRATQSANLRGAALANARAADCIVVAADGLAREGYNDAETLLMVALILTYQVQDLNEGRLEAGDALAVQWISDRLEELSSDVDAMERAP